VGEARQKTKYKVGGGKHKTLSAYRSYQGLDLKVQRRRGTEAHTASVDAYRSEMKKNPGKRTPSPSLLSEGKGKRREDKRSCSNTSTWAMFFGLRPDSPKGKRNDRSAPPKGGEEKKGEDTKVQGKANPHCLHSRETSVGGKRLKRDVASAGPL